MHFHEFLVMIAVSLSLLLSMPAFAATEPALATSLGDPKLAWGACPDVFPAGCQLAVLHGDPAKPNADVFFRIPGNYELPKHWHSSAERMILVEGELSVTYEGQAPVVLGPGMYAYGPPKRAHHGRCISAHACTLFIAFEGPVDTTLGAAPALRSRND